MPIIKLLARLVRPVVDEIISQRSFEADERFVKSVEQWSALFEIPVPKAFGPLTPAQNLKRRMRRARA